MESLVYDEAAWREFIKNEWSQEDSQINVRFSIFCGKRDIPVTAEGFLSTSFNF